MQQKAASHPQSRIDVVAAIEVGVIDQALPTHGGAGLLEINPHHDLERVLIALLGRGDCRGVFVGRGHIVHRAGPHDHQQTGITAMQDRLNTFPGLLDRCR